MHYRRSTAKFVQSCRIASSSIVLFGALAASGCGGGGGGSSGPPPTYSIGGSITGLSASGLVLANGTDTVSPASGAGSFTFGAPQASGASYAVSVQTHPAGQSCAVSGGSGSIGTANVVSVQVTCTTNILQGTIDGLVASGLVLANGSATVAPPVNATAFAFTMPLNHGDTYAVAVKTQPTGQSCQVSNGMGAAGATNKAIVVSCAGHQWTWLGGSNIANASGVYGTKNVAAASNMPGARAGSVTWADSQGALFAVRGLRQ